MKLMFKLYPEYRTLCLLFIYIKVKGVKFSTNIVMSFLTINNVIYPEISTKSPDGMFSRQVKFITMYFYILQYNIKPNNKI